MVDSRGRAVRAAELSEIGEAAAGAKEGDQGDAVYESPTTTWPDGI
ncbi:MAG TPA: hypothetical protein VEV17_03980 [Bryobacteraceae bacterium]|nr:hypothetical protein [Bryobacteraceae bacterium]